MNITFSVPKLMELGITPNEFTICMLLSEKRMLVLKEFAKTIPNFIEDIKHLKQIGYIQFTGLGTVILINELKITNSFLELITDFNFFDYFHSIFPVKVIRPDGKEDHLRLNKTKCKLLYNKITKKNKTIHNHLVDCLTKEIQDKTKTGNMGYFKQMLNWLKTEQWKRYEDKLGVKTDSVKAKDKYGTNIL
jgi:hypothetical protein